MTQPDTNPSIDKITILMPRYVEITVDEFRERTAPKTSPKLSLFDVVEYEGDYKKPAYATIVGISLRVGGWSYTGVSLRLNGSETVTFNEEGVIRIMGEKP